MSIYNLEPQQLEVYGGDQAIQLAVYSKNDPDLLLDLIPYRMEPTYLDEFGDGGGSFTLLKSDPRLVEIPNLLDYENTVRVFVRSVQVGRWIIKKRTDVIVGEGEESDEAIEVSGPGMRGWFSNAVVYPEGGVRPLAAQTRTFSFATAATGTWFDSGAWRPPVSSGAVRVTPTWGTAPAEWPDASSAQWIWDRNQSNGQPAAPAGDVYFRREFFTVDAKTDLELFITADNFFKAYIDGQLVHEESDHSGGAVWTETFSEKLTVGPGRHMLAVRATNEAYGVYAGVGAGALAVAMFKAGNAALGTAAQLMFVSAGGTREDEGSGPYDPNWLCLPYPASPPGFTPGELLNVLFNEARLRGAHGFQWLTLDATDDADSNGVPWPRALEWSFSVGTEYSEVVSKIEELMADFWIDQYDLSIKIFQQKGVDRSVGDDPVKLARAFNVTSASVDGDAASVKNALLIEYESGTFEWVDADHPAIDLAHTEGRFEGFLNTGSSTTLDRAQVVAEATYAQRAIPQESTTVEFVVLTDHVPWRDFGIGDWVLAPDKTGQLVKRRIMSLSVSEDTDTGRPIYAAEFDTVITTRTSRIERWLANTSDGTLGGTVQNASGRVQLGELSYLPGAASGLGSGGSSSGGGGGTTPTAPSGYTHTQSAAATTWNVAHNLGRYPSVTIIVGGQQVRADIVYTSLNTLTITFAQPQSGTAQVS